MLGRDFTPNRGLETVLDSASSSAAISVDGASQSDVATTGEVPTPVDDRNKGEDWDTFGSEMLLVETFVETGLSTNKGGGGMPRCPSKLPATDVSSLMAANASDSAP